MLEYIALGLLIFVVLVIFYGIIVIHDIPYEIARERNHPHQDAIHIAGWVSLFTLHALWPFLWIWATLWREDRGWGFARLQAGQQDLEQRIILLSDQIHILQGEIQNLKRDQAEHQAYTAESSHRPDTVPQQTPQEAEKPAREVAQDNENRNTGESA